MLDGHALACSAAAPGTVFLANRMGLFRSDDSGAHWADIEVERFSPLTYGRDLRVSPRMSRKVLYAAMSPKALPQRRRRDLQSEECRQDLASGSTYGGQGRRDDDAEVAVANPRDAWQVYGVSKRRGQVFGTQDGGVELGRAAPARGRWRLLRHRLRLMLLISTRANDRRKRWRVRRMFTLAWRAPWA